MVAACILLWLGLGKTDGGLPSPSGKLKEAAKNLPQYDLILRLNDEEHSFAISETLTYQNDTGDTLHTLMLRTFLNAYAKEETSPAALQELHESCYPGGFSAGGLTIYEVLWNGAPAAYTYQNADQTALEIAIDPLKPGETGRLTLRAVALIPNCAHRAGYLGQHYSLGHVIPLLSLYEEGAWRTDPYYPIGDPLTGNCANFSVLLHLPEGFIPACSAPLHQREDGAWQGEILAARELGLCLNPDYKLVTGKMGDTLLYSYALNEKAARRALDDAKAALTIFSRLYGPYPYPSFTVCSAPFPFGGMEYSALCMLGEGYYLESRADTLELIIAHETAHQWFYGLVGSDAVNHPWQDEAIAEYALLRFAKEKYGQSSFETLRYYRADAPMQENIPDKLTPGSPIHYFGNYADYRTVVYGRGAALMLALDRLLPKGLDEFLRAYVDQFQFQFVTREEFEVFLTQHTGVDCRPLLVDYLDTLLSKDQKEERMLA